MKEDQGKFDSMVDALLLSPEAANASPFIAVIPATPEKIMCFGTRQELIDGLCKQFWKDELSPDRLRNVK